MTAIKIEKLDKNYNGVEAVKNLNLTIEKGEVFGFLGPNGAGKSTTVNMIMDYVRPTSGQISVHGHDAQKDTKKLRSKVGILPDRYSLYPRLTGKEHIDFAIRTKGVDQEAEQILEKVGLDQSDAEKKVSQYSSGMRQRLAIGMAITGDPEVLILDEPSRGLDPYGIQTVRKIINEKKEDGGAVFFSSHILSQVEAVADKVGIIKEGQLIAVDSIEGLRQTIGSSTQLKVKFSEKPDLELGSLRRINGVADVIINENTAKISFSDSRAKIRVIEKLSKLNNQILDITSSSTSLEDSFTEYTMEK